jgi:hypothetical protein
MSQWFQSPTPRNAPCPPAHGHSASAKLGGFQTDLTPLLNLDNFGKANRWAGTFVPPAECANRRTEGLTR